MIMILYDAFWLVATGTTTGASTRTEAFTRVGRAEPGRGRCIIFFFSPRAIGI